MDFGFWCDSCRRRVTLTWCIRRIFKAVRWTAISGPIQEIGRLVHVLEMKRDKCWREDTVSWNDWLKQDQWFLIHIPTLTIHNPSNGTFSWNLWRLSYHHSCVTLSEKSGYAVRPGHTWGIEVRIILIIIIIRRIIICYIYRTLPWIHWWVSRQVGREPVKCTGDRCDVFILPHPHEDPCTTVLDLLVLWFFSFLLISKHLLKDGFIFLLCSCFVCSLHTIHMYVCNMLVGLADIDISPSQLVFFLQRL